MSGTTNKVVAITGASSGIGEATAPLLAERGANVVLGARGPDRLAALADQIVRTGGEALTHRPTSGVAMIRPRWSSWRASGTGNSTCSSTTLA